ncbi:MAG: FG-GAP repeat protein [Marinicella sp.]
MKSTAFFQFRKTRLTVICVFSLLLIALNTSGALAEQQGTTALSSNSGKSLNAITPNDTIEANDGVANDGFAVAISVWGHRVLVGAEGQDEVADSAGAAYIYEFNGVSWDQVDKLTADDGASYDYFGGAVALWGDVAMVGARGDDGLTGAVYVFNYNGVDWVQVDKLTASDAASGDMFGNAISLKGNRLLVGAPRDDDNAYNSGAVYIFEYDGMDWNEQPKLLPDGAVFEELFGSAVSLDGDRALVGAYNGKNPSNARSGIAYVFHFDGINWIQKGKMFASDGAETDYFGFSVSLSGDRALIGSHGHGFYTGAAYLYTYDGNNWGQELKLTSNNAELDDYFGTSVSLNHDRALIGATRGDNDNMVDSGSAYVFDYNDGNWVQALRLFDNTGAVNDVFGFAVGLTNSWLIAGSPGTNSSKGIVHIYLDDPVYQDGFD